MNGKASIEEITRSGWSGGHGHTMKSIVDKMKEFLSPAYSGKP